MICDDLKRALRLPTRAWPPALRASVTAHVEGCQACREELLALVAIERELSRIESPHAGATFSERVMQEVASIAAPRRPVDTAGGRSLAPWLLMAMGATVGVFGGEGGFLSALPIEGFAVPSGLGLPDARSAWPLVGAVVAAVNALWLVAFFGKWKARET
jgi:anti-sigma factor RsiW